MRTRVPKMKKDFSCCGSIIPVYSKDGKVIGHYCAGCKKTYAVKIMSAHNYQTR